MDINSGSKCFVSIANALVTSLLSVLCNFNAKPGDERQQSRLDADPNQLICNQTKGSDSTNSRVRKAVEILEFVSKCGSIVSPVADLERHHHVKRASAKNCSDKVTSETSTRAVIFQLNEVNQRLLSGNMSDEDHYRNMKKMKKLAKRKISSGIDIIDVTRLHQQMVEEQILTKANESSGMVRTMITGQHQAEVLVSKSFVEKNHP